MTQEAPCQGVKAEKQRPVWQVETGWGVGVGGGSDQGLISPALWLLAKNGPD